MAAAQSAALAAVAALAAAGVAFSASAAASIATGTRIVALSTVPRITCAMPI